LSLGVAGPKNIYNIAPYNDDVMRRVFKLMIRTFRDLENSSGSTFGKKIDILGGMAMTRTYEVMFDLECDDLILHMFHLALGNIILTQS